MNSMINNYMIPMDEPTVDDYHLVKEARRI